MSIQKRKKISKIIKTTTTVIKVDLYSLMSESNTFIAKLNPE